MYYNGGKMKTLVTGGLGFIGCNVVRRLIQDDDPVIVFDNLSRNGSQANLDWLKKQGDFAFANGDVRNRNDLKQVFSENGDIEVVIHLAAQVAVTTSVVDPREDFETNALGTFNILEAIRGSKTDTILLNASTNKVYGKMDDVKITQRNGRYEYESIDGIAEHRSLDFHSPYGCSKGAADQYVCDYARIYGIRTVNLRQSCIYGLRQFGVEDQGWVAWFTIASVLNKKITIYGDGKQVRDVLFIDDLVDCYLSAIENIHITSGKTYNIGGGPNNRMSLFELLALLEEYSGKKIDYSFDDWRPGDQLVFVCDISKAERDFDWKPKIGVREGVRKLYDWVENNKELFDKE